MSRRGPLRRAWKRLREGCLDRLGLLYGRRFYARADRHKGASDQAVAATLIARYQPARVVDLGCGNGAFLAALAARGVSVLGLERSRAGLALCRERGVPAQPFDLRQDEPPAAAADLVLCFEVAEHLPATAADRLVEVVTRLGARAVFTAAPPGQGGVGHLNEQPPGYWIDRFAARGWRYDGPGTAAVRAEWAAHGVVSWLVVNVMVFEQAG